MISIAYAGILKSQLTSNKFWRGYTLKKLDDCVLVCH